MASASECESALRGLAEMLAGVEPDLRKKYVVERSLSCRISDLQVTWSGRVTVDGLVDLRNDDDSRAQVRLTVGSDDFIALIEGRLAVPTAFATGRLRVQASPFDLLRLGTFL